MARVQFDKTHILKQASNVFWRFGYNATSMQTVFDATGLKPGSIYLAFGNKEGLFKESLQHYTQSSLDKLEARITRAPSIGQGIYAILMDFLEESCKSNYCSCFLVKSQLELSAEPKLQAYISQNLHQVELLYLDFLKQLYPEDEAAIKATSLMLHIFGIRVYGYHSQSRSQMLTALQLGLPWLPWPKAHF